MAAGKEIISAFGGSDGTAEYDTIGHSKFANRLLSRYQIGVVQVDDRPVPLCGA